MIAPWILYALIVGALASVAAAAADRVVCALRQPSRWVWVAALAFTVAWPVATLIDRPEAPSPVSGRASSPLSTSLQRVTISAARASERALRIELNTVLIGAWALASLALTLRLGHGVWRLSARRRLWRAESIDGIAVRVSDDVGPAVVGLRRAEVVLPNWALTLDAPLRAFVLRHEQEHRRAGDPWLLAIAALAVVVAPWNVALWWQARRIRLAVELDCDARVLRADPAPERYGLLLLSIAQRRSVARPSFVAGLLEPVNHLERRITAMTPGAHTLSRTRAVALGALAVTAIIAACRADAPPAPAARATAAQADSAPPTIATEEGRVVADSAMITITRKEYERLKASAGKSLIPNADTMPNDLVRLARRARERAVDSAISVRLSTTMEGRADSLRVRIEPIIERGVVGDVRPRVDSIREQATAADSAHWEFQVERPAQWIAGTGTPRYPVMLKAAGIQGTVLASFVVDTTGRVDVTTLRILRSPQELFSVAVRNALPEMRFTPAQVSGGRRVKQVIQQEFKFEIQP